MQIVSSTCTPALTHAFADRGRWPFQVEPLPARRRHQRVTDRVPFRQRHLTAAADLRGPGLPRRTCSEWRELQKWSPDSTPATELVAGGEDAGRLLRRRTVATLGRRFAAGPPGAGQDSDPFRSPAGLHSPARQPQKHVAATAVESPPLGVRAVDTRAAIRQSSSPLGNATGGRCMSRWKQERAFWTVILALGFPSACDTPPQPSPTEGVTVYQHPDFRGDSYTFVRDFNNFDDLRGAMRDSRPAGRQLGRLRLFPEDCGGVGGHRIRTR